ncbi:MAG: ATP-binding protein [Rhodanobacteraceae bacterium]|nr:ATP-binding protein [Rhodanobacteraceae bacterium]
MRPRQLAGAAAAADRQCTASRLRGGLSWHASPAYRSGWQRRGLPLQRRRSWLRRRRRCARAFDAFYTTARQRGHVGLGLHLVHNIVTQVLGGSIQLDSSPGTGSELVWTVPLD